MKFLALLMAVYILCVSWAPCADGHPAMSVAQETLSRFTPPGNPAHPDTCPPFCACSCCGVQTAVEAFSLLSEPSLIGDRLIPIHHTIFFSRPTGDIWQPPKIS